MSKQNEMHTASSDLLRVMTPEDRSPEDSLDAISKKILRNRYDILIANLDTLMSDYKSQRAFVENRLENSPTPSQLSTFRSAGKDIPYHHIVRIATACGLTPEQLTGQLLDQSAPQQDECQQAPRPEQEYRKYVGTYHMAYFRTDSKPGRNRRDLVDSLSFGMITVLPLEKGSAFSSLQVVAFSYCTPEEREFLMNATTGAIAQKNRQGVYTCYNKLICPTASQDEESRKKYLYMGELTLTERVAEITLRQCGGVDVVHISLPNQAAISSQGHNYSGGSGAMLSTSRGSDHMPCGQGVILSRKGFENVALEEIAEQLLPELSEIDLHREVKDIITYMKLLFPDGDADGPTGTLSLEDREYMLGSFIQMKVTNAIQRNLLFQYKVSKDTDEFVYKGMCR